MNYIGNIREKILVLREVIGIDYTEISKHAFCSYSHIKQSKGKIVQLSEESFNPYEETPIKRGLPVSISISGDGILHKSVLKKADIIEPFEIIEQTFPGISIDDFYFQLFENEGQIHVALARKSYCHKVLELFNNFNIIRIILGGLSLEALSPLINTASYTLPYHTVEFTSSGLNGYTFCKTENETTQILIPGTSSKSTVAYANAISCIASDSILLPDISGIQENFTDAHYQSISKKVAIVAPVVLLSILIINYLIFNFYFNNNIELEQKASYFSKRGEEYQNISSNLNKKETFLLKNDWANKIPVTQTIDEIIYSTTNNINLISLDVNPIDKKESTDDDPFIFTHKTIEIKGSTNIPTALNEWISKFRDIKWVESTEITEYYFDPRTNQNTFKLLIHSK